MRQHLKLILLMLCCYVVTSHLSMAAQYKAGDLAPKGAPDSVLNVADFLMLQRIINGDETPSPTELILGDVGPLGSPDDILNVADLLILKRAILGDVILDNVIVYPEAPTLNSTPATTVSNPITVTGSATPGHSVHISVNNATQIIIPVDGSGAFSFQANLYDGANQIYAFANDGEHFSAPSNLLNTSYTNTIDRNQSGTIPENTVWTPGVPAVPYVISGADLIIPVGKKLVIQPGTIVQTNNSTNIIVEGNLEISGTEFNQVLMTSMVDARNKWSGIKVLSTGVVNINYAIVENSSWYGVRFEGGAGTITNSIIRNSYIYGIGIRNASPTLSGNQIIDNGQSGIVIERGSNPIITDGNVITNNWIYGIEVNGEAGMAVADIPQPIINRNAIYGNDGNASYIGDIRFNDFDNARGTVINLQENWWGSNDLDFIAGRVYGFWRDNTPVADYSYFLDAENGEPVQANYLMGDLPDGFILEANKSYTVLKELHVQTGTTVDIEEGATLRFGTGMSFHINGAVNWLGTKENPAYFTRYETGYGEWTGIVFDDGVSNVVVNAIKVDLANYGLKLVNVLSGAITNSVFENNGIGVYLDSSDVLVDSNLIQFNTIDGIDILYGASPTITNNIIVDNGKASAAGSGIAISRHDRISGEYPTPSIHDNQIFRNSYNDIAATNYTGSDPTPPIIDATNNWWGTNDALDIESTIKHFPDNTSSNIYSQTTYIDYSGFYANVEKTETDNREILFNVHEMTQDEVIPANSRLIVPEDIKIPLGMTLTIEEGVELYFVADKKIEVLGSLNINGTLSNPVLLTGAKTLHDYYDLGSGNGEWDGIQINNNDGGVNINYANIEYATIGVDFINSDGTILNSIFTNNYNAIRIFGDSSPLIQSSVITNNFYGIQFTGSGGIDPSPTISGNDIYNNIVLRYQSPNIAANIAFNNITNPQLIDLSNNWWNTVDIASTRATFYDPYSSFSDDVVITNIDTQANRSDITYVTLALSESIISPATSLGSYDSLSMTATSAQSINWEIKIRNNSQSVVKAFVGTGVNINQVWDGRNASTNYVPDGVYTISLIVNGGTEQLINKVVVDNTVPEVDITNISDGDILGNTGATSKIVIGNANDSNFVSYQLSVANGFTPMQEDFREIQPNKTASAFMGVLTTWPFADTTNALFETSGPKTLRLTALDLAGNTSVYDVKINIFIVLTDVSHDVDSIDVSKGEEVAVNFTLHEPATVTLQLFYEKDEAIDENIIVTVSEIFESDGNHQLKWDGKDSEGNYLLDDAYRYALLVETAESTYLYRVDANAPADGSVFLGQDYESNSFKNDFVKFSYTLTNPLRINLNGYVTEPKGVGTHHLYWDHRNQSNQLYDVSVQLQRPTVSALKQDSFLLQGGQTKILGTEYDPDTVIATPTIEVQSTPSVVLHSYEQISEIAFRVSQDSYVDVQLLSPCYVSDTSCTVDHDDPNGITLMARQLLTSKDSGDEFINHTVEWRGYDFMAPVIDENNIRVSEEGAYTFSIRAESSATGLITIYRGVINLHH